MFILLAKVVSFLIKKIFSSTFNKLLFKYGPYFFCQIVILIQIWLYICDPLDSKLIDGTRRKNHRRKNTRESTCYEKQETKHQKIIHREFIYKLNTISSSS